jgi:hypothetical protein
MTAGSQLKQTLAALHSARGTLRAYANQARDEEARQAYAGGVTELDAVITELEGRLGFLEREEPQYQGL